MALWLWIGGGVMALGTVLAAWPGRRRRGRPILCPARSPPEDPPGTVEPVGGADGRHRPARRADRRSDRRSRIAGGGRRRIAVLVSRWMVAVLATRDPSTERPTQSPLIGELAPPTAGDHARRGGGSTSTDHGGRWVVVNFFATWCVPCLEEHPELVAFDAAHSAEGDAVLVRVTFDDNADDARRVLRGARW